LIWHTASYK
jgi:hypothetical protein